MSMMKAAAKQSSSVGMAKIMAHEGLRVGTRILGAGLKMTWLPLRTFSQFCLDFACAVSMPGSCEYETKAWL
jgi:hypothetical protein